MTNPVPVFKCGTCNRTVIGKVENPSCIVEPSNSPIVSRIMIWSPDREHLWGCPIKRSVVYDVIFDYETDQKNFGFTIKKRRDISTIAHRCLPKRSEKKDSKPSSNVA